MKEPKNVRIIVVPVGQMEREDLEHIKVKNKDVKYIG